MKNFIEGFNQNGLVSLGLDCSDTILIRYIVDFFHSSKMKKIIIDNKVFIWISYKKVIEDLPILNINKRSIAKKFDKYISCGLMEKFLDVDNGNYTYFRFTEVYDVLVKQINDPASMPEDTGMALQDNAFSPSQPEVCSSLPKPQPLHEQTNIVLLNSSISIDKLNNNNYVENNAFEVLEHFNKISGKNFKPFQGNLKCIKARLNDGFSVDELKRVIDHKVNEWKNNDKMKVYIRPQTIFNPEKIDSYLNCSHEPEIDLYEDESLFQEPPAEEDTFDFDPEQIKNPILKKTYYKYFVGVGSSHENG